MSLRTLRTLVTAVLLTLVVAPIATLPYSADDTLNRQWATQSWWQSIRSSYDINLGWMIGQGRFFPGGSVYGLPVWHLLASRAAYMTYLVLLDLALIGLVGFVVFRMTKSPVVAAGAALTLGACMQVRWYLDGISSFGGLVVYTLILTILSGLGAAAILRTGRRWIVIPTVVVWSLAVTTYEVSLLMLPAVLALIVVTHDLRDRRRAAWALGPLLVPAALQLVITFYLRSRATGPAPGYTTDFGGPVGTTFMKQFTAALPSSQYLLGGVPDGVQLPLALVLMLVLVLAVPVFLLWRPALHVGVSVSRRVAMGLMAAGAWAWLVPSVLAGVTQRWQMELTWGQGYVYLAYEYVGVALLAGGALCLLADREASKALRIGAFALVAVVCVACAVTVAANLVYAGQFVPGPAGPG